MTRVSGQVLAHVQGSGDPRRCARLDACAVTGTIAIRPRLTGSGSAQVSAIGPAQRPYGDFLAALGLRRGGNPRGIKVVPFVSFRDSGTVTAAIRNLADCRDEVRLRTSYLTLNLTARGLQAGYSALASSVDPLRTRCPGPLAGDRPLARGSAPRSVLGRRRLTLRLHGDAFRDAAYHVRTISGLSVTLARTGISQSVC